MAQPFIGPPPALVHIQHAVIAWWHRYWWLVIVGYALFMALVIVVKVHLRKRTPDSYGVSAWSTRRAMKRKGLFRPYGVILAKLPACWYKPQRPKYLYSGLERHTFMCGKTRSGKSVTAMSTLLTWPESLFCLAQKDELLDLALGYRMSQGDACYVFAPGMRESDTLDPLSFI